VNSSAGRWRQPRVGSLRRIPGPLAIQYGWRAAFMMTGALGLGWLVLWAVIARPPFLPASPPKPSRMTFPNLFERRAWALIFSYALPAISPGPVLTILSLYLTGRLGLTQADVNSLAWIPPLTWGIGYFFWGWVADTYAANNARPVGLFLILTIASVTLGAATWTTSVAMTMTLISFSTFIGGGFQMVALKVGSYAFPREQSAMMSGIASGSWSLVNFVLLRVIGAWSGWMNAGQWEEIFWLIALMPAAGVAAWMVLSRGQATAPAAVPVKV